MEEFGYLIVERQAKIYANYLNKILPLEGVPYLNRLRLAFPAVNPDAYRGVYREQLEGGTPELVDELTNPARVLPGRGWDVSTRQARLKMAELLARKFEESSNWQDYTENEKMFLKLEDALQIYHLLGNPDDHEIILARRRDYDWTPTTFGFDIGYWAGDNYSIICDTFVRPQWHSAPEEEFHNLTSFATRLNSNVLFDSFEHAQEFLAYYRTTDWGEPDGTFDSELGTSDYTIIQVDGVIS